jgi:ATP-dependent protease HslVU (ClpYQ) ATPase subunit
LVSPLECRIAHYRNIKEFINQLDRFSKKMRLGELNRLFVPTKVSHHRKISVQIRDFYRENIEGCTKSSIRESIVGEEAVANRLSFIESSNKVVSDDIREFLIELNDVLNPEVKQRAEQTIELNVVDKDSSEAQLQHAAV